MENFSSEIFALANPDKALKMKAYMKDLFPFVGLYAQDRKLVQSPFFKEYKSELFADLEELVLQLWSRPEREFQYTAIELLSAKHKVWDETVIILIKKLILDKSWWDSVDLLAASVLFKALNKFSVPYELVVHDYLESGNMWLQRSAIIVQLKRKKETDLDLLTHAIVSTKDNKEFFIQKAIGWSLREVSKWNPLWVMEQVEELELQGLAKREALKKIK